MIELTTIAWILIIFGIVIHLPLLYAQILLIRDPNSQKTKDLLIAPGQDWRDTSNMEFSLGFAWADLLMYAPILLVGTLGIIMETTWGYLLYSGVGLIAVYFSIVFWVAEKKYTLPTNGSIMYYTFFWGFFFYWGIAAFVYSISKLEN